MSKFCGKVGYGITKQVKPGVWEEIIEEKDVVGDLLKNTYRQNVSSSVNPKIVLNNTVSVILDPYMLQNYNLIRYISFRGIAWNVDSVEVQYPRLVLTLGGEYHGKE